MSSILRTISRYQQIQLEKKGATVTDNLITASDAVLWHTLSPYQRKQLEKLGQVEVSGGGGGGDYVAKAVHFANGSYLQQLNTALADTSKLTYSGWRNFAAEGGSFSAVPVVGFSIHSPSFDCNQAFAVNWNDTLDIGGRFEVAPGSPFQLDFGSANGLVALDTWFHIFISVDTNFSTGNKLKALWVGGVDVLDPSNNYDAGGGAFAFTVNGLAIELPVDSLGAPTQGITRCADDQLWIGQRIDPAVDDNILKFIAGGKPVDPAVAATAFGQPTILLSGDASATGYMKNQGTLGDVFSLIGDPLTNASSSPSD